MDRNVAWASVCQCTVAVQQQLTWRIMQTRGGLKKIGFSSECFDLTGDLTFITELTFISETREISSYGDAKDRCCTMSPNLSPKMPEYIIVSHKWSGYAFLV